MTKDERLDIRLEADLKADLIQAAARETQRRGERVSTMALTREAIAAYLEALHNLHKEAG